MELEQHVLTLSTGKTGWYEYDRESDLLEIIFRETEAACAIELTESIVLRFDWKTSEPLSLSFLSVSKLLKPTEDGEVFFQLLTEEWPEEAREKVWTMLRKPPVNEFLKISNYVPMCHALQAILMQLKFGYYFHYNLFHQHKRN